MGHTKDKPCSVHAIFHLTEGLTAARESIDMDFALIAVAYGFDADVEELIVPSSWRERILFSAAYALTYLPPCFGNFVNSQSNTSN